MIIVYLVYLIIFVVFIAIFVRIIQDHIDYYRNMPKAEKKPKVKAQPLTEMKITVNRRESSGLTSFTVWDFFLNGENIGRIKDGESLTVTTKKRKNLLEAKDSHGALSPPYMFFVETGSGSQVTFNDGRFKNPQGMDIVLPSDEGFRKITSALNTRRWAWVYWVVLAGYYTAVFMLFSGQVALMLALPFLPIPVLALIGWPAYRELVDYISYNYPEAWGRISRDMHRPHLVGSVIFFDNEIDDLDYLGLRIHYEKFLAAQILSSCICMGTFIFTIANAVNN